MHLHGSRVVAAHRAVQRAAMSVQHVGGDAAAPAVTAVRRTHADRVPPRTVRLAAHEAVAHEVGVRVVEPGTDAAVHALPPVLLLEGLHLTVEGGVAASGSVAYAAQELDLTDRLHALGPQHG